ncbi:hypothetical protein A447_02478 [Fusobacterium vincentii ATCC 51190]|uniref:DUF721 domain-containing protein n=1 Tax=Fusobacterium vincentii TaxID=155615 RepID=A0AAJ1FN61_FUSVC|nr:MULTISPECIES: hypothetical protein [Fusobacterium]ETT06790.1 hypothetical protein HMPREF1497_0942 [Fusobacterium sp. CM21]EJG09776.1 hypothetical protein A447_02478 [Fusobacterium vincentii ATCC 51190]ERT46771.1 hypothetical protein HMPREF1768_00594 [Fusobacterium nucleatum CTI-7]MCW0263915.1 hypothetical protein [Fusobacterium vincentii]MDH2315794.1 hypothetical protein [Fusobacterium nucleatum]
MKVVSINEIATFKISTDNRIKLMILKEKWKKLFLDLSQNSSVIDFKENTIYIKGYNSAVKHYIFTNKIKIIEQILENLETKFEIVDIKVK